MKTTEIQALWRQLPLGEGTDLARLDRQIAMNPEAWQAAARFLLEQNLKALPLGRNEIGHGAFANVAEYETKLHNVYELHRRYIDVQLLAFGQEEVYVADKDKARLPMGDYDEAGDFILFEEADDARPVLVSPEHYQLFYPSDAHKPCMAVDGCPQPVRKICLKMPYAK